MKQIYDQREDYITMCSTCKKERQRINDAIEKKEKQIERLKKKRDNSRMPFWGEALVRPLADELINHLPGAAQHDDSFIPMGMTSCITVFFKNKAGKTIGRIGFRPGDLDNGEVLVVDYNNPDADRTYSQDPNGYRFPSKDIPKYITDLVKFITN